MELASAIKRQRRSVHVFASHNIWLCSNAIICQPSIEIRSHANAHVSSMYWILTNGHFILSECARASSSCALEIPKFSGRIVFWERQRIKKSTTSVKNISRARSILPDWILVFLLLGATSCLFRVLFLHLHDDTSNINRKERSWKAKIMEFWARRKDFILFACTAYFLLILCCIERCRLSISILYSTQAPYFTPSAWNETRGTESSSPTARHTDVQVSLTSNRDMFSFLRIEINVPCHSLSDRRICLVGSHLLHRWQTKTLPYTRRGSCFRLVIRP